MDVFENLTNCVYEPDMDFPERTDPDFETKHALYLAQEAEGVAHFISDLFTHFNVQGNPKAELAFKIAYDREHGLGLFAVADLFESLLPLVAGVH